MTESRVNETGKVDPAVFQALQMADLVRINAASLKLARDQIVKGELFYNEIVVPANTFIRIDYLEGQHEGIPTNTRIFIPRGKVYRLTVVNNGEGDLRFAHVQHAGDRQVSILLRKNEDIEIPSSLGNIKYLNLLSTAGCTVRLIAVN